LAARAAILALAALPALAGFVAPPARAAVRLRPCPKKYEPLECGTVRVPLDPSGATAGSVALHVELVPAAGPPKGVVLALAGGPGQSATSVRDAFESLVPGDRQLVILDQRGTGRSGALRCPELERSLGLAEGRSDAEICAERLGPARGLYTTRESVADVEAVRRALEVDRLEIVGVSYGTKVALAYAAAHPDHVERLLLDSVVPAVEDDPFLTDPMTAARRALRAACTGPCPSYSDDPGSDLRSLIEGMAAGPLKGYYVNARGRRRAAAVGRLDLYSLLLVGDFLPFERALLTAALAGAVRGDVAPLERLKRTVLRGAAGGIPRRAFSIATFVATTCEEEPMPWPRGTPVAQRHELALAASALRPSDAFAPLDRETILAQSSMCERWPTASAPPPATAPSAAVPTLLLEGADDIRTPVETARGVAARIPGARLVLAPGGHDVTSGPCGTRLAARFLAGRSVGDCTAAERSQGKQPPAAPLAPLRLQDVAPPRGVGGIPGRTLAAVASTVGDTLEQSGGVFGLLFSDQDVLRGGGLRGGSWVLRFTERDFRLGLDGDEYVPGVRVSGGGPIYPDLRLRVKVSGSAAARGTVILDASGAHGRLDGRRFAVAPGAFETSTRSLSRVARVVRARRAAARRRPPAPSWLIARALR
jgi:pimeloyl-ACP methyl ester carboxylesterase